jgi:molecular chaperone GrpE (heat shock protein)
MLMVEEPNLFWFGVFLWVGGTAFFLSLIGGKSATAPVVDLDCQYEFDPLLSDRLKQANILSWALFQRKAGLTPNHLRQLRQGSLDLLSFAELNRLARTLNWTLEELLQAYGVTFPSLGSAFQEVAKLHSQGQQLYNEKTELQEQLTRAQTGLTVTTNDLVAAQERIQLLETELERREHHWQTTLEDANNQVLQLQQQCRRLRTEVQQQRDQLTIEFQYEMFEVLQTLLMNFPTATVMAEAKPTLPARNVVALFSPLRSLLHQWGYQAIGDAWGQVFYDPQLHQPDSPDIREGELVYVRFVGYRDGDRILCPAKVSRTLPRT